MATTDEPQKLEIGGAGYKYWSLIIPIVVFIALAIISFVFPNLFIKFINIRSEIL